MARGIDRIWVRFGLWIAGTILVTIGILAVSVTAFRAWQCCSYQHELLPPGEKWSLVIGLIVCLPFGLIAGFWVSRVVTLPMASIAQAAQRIALGDFSVRAQPGRQKGEMAEMVADFNHMTDSLEQLERERKATAAAISHELRTPLAVLRVRLHAVCDGIIQPNEKEFGKLLKQVEHLGRLVEDLHTLSMADAGRLSLQQTEVDLVALANDTLADHAGRLAQAGMHAVLRTDSAAAVVHADKDRMRQVLSNLVENALRHASAGGWLEIGLAMQPVSKPAVAVLTVSDAGPGLSPEIRKHLFERFMRSDSSRSRATGGSGLGLSIVRTLVERQGGSIDAGRSERGGTQFTIRMPCSANAAAKHRD